MLGSRLPGRGGFYLYLIQNVIGMAGITALSCLLVYLLDYVFSFDQASSWENAFITTDGQTRTPRHFIILMALLCIVTLFAYGRAFLRGLYEKLLYHGIFDQPNERSMHFREVPRGGGWLIVVAICGYTLFLLAWLFALHYLAMPFASLAQPMAFLKTLFQDGLNMPAVSIAGGMLLIAVISWMDDLVGLGVIYRLTVHGAAVTLGLSAMPFLPEVLPQLPAIMVYLLFGLLWLGFVNIYNFMDGIDGITAGQTISVMGGLLLVYFTMLTLAPAGYVLRLQTYPDIWLLGVVVGACLAFLSYNWHPARIFLGDVGSVPLGYIVGYSLLSLVQQGYWYIALTLPLYYLADGGFTLLRRIVTGEKFWLPHRSHYYQRGALVAGRHDVVVLNILLCNLALVGIAVLALIYSPWICAAALIPVILLLHRLAHWPPPRSRRFNA